MSVRPATFDGRVCTRRYEEFRDHLLLSFLVSLKEKKSRLEVGSTVELREPGRGKLTFGAGFTPHRDSLASSKGYLVLFSS